MFSITCALYNQQPLLVTHFEDKSCIHRTKQFVFCKKALCTPTNKQCCLVIYQKQDLRNNVEIQAKYFHLHLEIYIYN